MSCSSSNEPPAKRHRTATVLPAELELFAQQRKRLPEEMWYLILDFVPCIEVFGQDMPCISKMFYQLVWSCTGIWRNFTYNATIHEGDQASSLAPKIAAKIQNVKLGMYAIHDQTVPLSEYTSLKSLSVDTFDDRLPLVFAKLSIEQARQLQSFSLDLHSAFDKVDSNTYASCLEYCTNNLKFPSLTSVKLNYYHNKGIADLFLIIGTSAIQRLELQLSSLYITNVFRTYTFDMLSEVVLTLWDDITYDSRLVYNLLYFLNQHPLVTRVKLRTKTITRKALTYLVTTFSFIHMYSEVNITTTMNSIDKDTSDCNDSELKQLRGGTLKKLELNDDNGNLSLRMARCCQSLLLQCNSSNSSSLLSSLTSVTLNMCIDSQLVTSIADTCPSITDLTLGCMKGNMNNDYSMINFHGSLLSDVTISTVSFSNLLGKALKLRKLHLKTWVQSQCILELHKTSSLRVLTWYMNDSDVINSAGTVLKNTSIERITMISNCSEQTIELLMKHTPMLRDFNLTGTMSLQLLDKITSTDENWPLLLKLSTYIPSTNDKHTMHVNKQLLQANVYCLQWRDCATVYCTMFPMQTTTDALRIHCNEFNDIVTKVIIEFAKSAVKNTFKLLQQEQVILMQLLPRLTELALYKLGGFEHVSLQHSSELKHWFTAQWTLKVIAASFASTVVEQEWLAAEDHFCTDIIPHILQKLQIT